MLVLGKLALVFQVAFFAVSVHSSDEQIDLAANRMRTRKGRGGTKSSSTSSSSEESANGACSIASICNAYFVKAREEREDEFGPGDCNFDGTTEGCYMSYNGTGLASPEAAEEYTNLACTCHLGMVESCGRDFPPCVFASNTACSAQEDPEALDAFTRFAWKVDAIQRDTLGEIDLGAVTTQLQDCFNERESKCGCYYMMISSAAQPHHGIGFQEGAVGDFDDNDLIDHCISCNPNPDPGFEYEECLLMCYLFCEQNPWLIWCDKLSSNRV